MLQRIRYEDAQISTAQIGIHVVSIKPLLTHNPESMGSGAGAKKGSRVPDADVEAEAGTYRLSDGTCAIKGECFRGAILLAASAWKGPRRSSMAGELAHIVIAEELIPLVHYDGKPIKDYAIDARRAIVQKQGIIRHRPRFDEWACEFTIEYDPLLIRNPKLIVDILQDAGNRIGVGDYRPARKGFFGRFLVKEYWFV
jgi:hypothetical protein